MIADAGAHEHRRLRRGERRDSSKAFHHFPAFGRYDLLGPQRTRSPMAPPSGVSHRLDFAFRVSPRIEFLMRKDLHRAIGTQNCDLLLWIPIKNEGAQRNGAGRNSHRKRFQFH